MLNLSKLFFFNIIFPYFLILPIFLCFLVKTAFKGIWKMWELRQYIPFDTTDTCLYIMSFSHISSFMWLSMIKSFSRNRSFVSCGWTFWLFNAIVILIRFILCTTLNRECCCTEKELIPYTGVCWLGFCSCPKFSFNKDTCKKWTQIHIISSILVNILNSISYNSAIFINKIRIHRYSNSSIWLWRL